MFYRDIIKNSLKIAWNNKYLWFFGLFAGLLGNGGEYEIIFRGVSKDGGHGLWMSLNGLAETGIFSAKAIPNIGRLFVKEPLTMIMILVVGLIILVLFGFLIWLMIVSQAAIVNNASMIRSRRKNNFQDGLSAGIKYFWPALGLNAAQKLIVGLVMAALNLPLMLAVNRTGLVAINTIYGILFVISIPIAISISFIAKYAVAYVVIKGKGSMEALKSGWRLFLDNWLVSLEMALLLFAINLVRGVALFLLFLVMAVPFLFLLIMFQTLALVLGFWLLVFFAMIFMFCLIAVVGGALAAFQISAWTNLFIELNGKGGTSKLVRLVSKLQ